MSLLAPAWGAHAALTVNSIDLPTRIGRGQTVASAVNYVRFSGSGPEAVVVNVPAELEIVAPLPAGCSLAGASGSAQTLTCPAVNPGAAGATGSFALSVAGRALGGGLVTASNAGPPVSVAQNSFSVVSGGDLTLVKTVAPSAVFVNGQSPAFTLTPTLAGDTLPSGATVTITDLFPGGAGEFTLAAYTAPGYSCNSVAAANAARRLVCTIAGPLANLAPITLQGRLTAAGAGALQNNASIAADGINYIDTQPSNDLAAVSFVVNNGADPRPTGSFPAPAPTSSPQTLTINYVNDGPQSTTGGQVRVAIPAGFVIGPLPAGCSLGAAGVVNGVSGTLVTCASATVTGGGSQSFVLPLTTPSSAQSGNFGVEIVTAAGGVLPDGVTDADTTNNLTLVPYVIVSPYADLSVAKYKTAGPIAADSDLDSDIFVTNNGVAAAVYSDAAGATPLRIVETMPNNEAFVGVNNNVTPGWTCSSGVVDSGGTGFRRVVCARTLGGTLAVGASLNVRLITHVAAAITGPTTLTNTACSGAQALIILGLPPSAGPQPPDGNQAGGADCASASVIGTPVVSGQAQVLIVKESSRDGAAWFDSVAAAPTVAATDNSIYWRMTVTTPTGGVQRTVPTLVLTDTLPAILNVPSPSPGIPGYVTPAPTVTATLSPGVAGSCEAIAAGSSSLRCAFTDVAPGSSIQVVVRVDRQFEAGSFTNTAFLSSPDAILTGTAGAPLSDAAAITVAGRSDPAVTSKIVNPPAAARIGQVVNYAIVARNLGPNQVTGPLTVTDTLPTDKFLVLSASALGSGSSPAMNCSFVVATGAVTCATGAGTTVSRYDFYTINIQARLIKPATLPVPVPNDHSNTARVALDPAQNCEVTAGVTDVCNHPDAVLNNRQSVVLDIQNPRIDLLQQITRVLPTGQSSFGFGDTLRYRFREQNIGPSRAENVFMIDRLTLPAGAYSMALIGIAPGSVNGVPAEAGFGLDTSKNGTVSCAQPAGANGDVTCTLANGAAGFLDPASEVNFDLLFSFSGPTSVVTVGNTPHICADESSGYETNGGCSFVAATAGNNIAAINESIFPKTDWSISKARITASPVNINQPVQYALTVQNLGPSNTSQVRVADLLPANFEWVSGAGFTPAATAGGFAGLSVGTPACTATPAAITAVGQQQTINCVLNGTFPGSAAASNTVVLTLWARPKAEFFTSPYGVNATNTASVAPGLDGGGLPLSIDVNPANDSAAAVTQVQAASLSGTVFEDRERSGSNGGVPQAASAEPRIAGVTITLTGTDLYGNAITRSAVTDANGNYSFTDLPPSSLVTGYTVSQTQPAGLNNGPTAPPTSGVNAPSAGGTFVSGGLAGDSSYTTVALAGNTQGVNYNFPEVRRVSLSGFVYIDLNSNGVRDAATDPAIVGAAVTLRNASTGAVVASTATVAGGAYSFSNLDPLIPYTLEEVLPTSPTGLLNGPINPGLINGVACTSGCTAQANTPAVNTDRISAIDLSAGLDGTQFNFGELQVAAISGTVYIDRNASNTLDATPTDGRIPGVLLRLVQGAVCTGTELQQTTTDTNGNYSFPNVPVGGSYAICEVQPVGYANGAENPGASSAATPGANVITIASLVPGGSAGNHFGERVASLTGAVYVDYSPLASVNTNNGVHDAGETGIAGVPVTLSGTNAAGTTFTRTTTTDASGNYGFADLLQSDSNGYTLTEGAIPAAAGVFNDGKDTAGSSGGSNAVNDSLSAIALAAGVNATAYNFGELPIAPISGTVYIDRDRDGTLGGADGRIAGVVLRLVLGGSCAGPDVVRTTTDASGNYVFSGISAGLTYTLCEVQPTGYADGSTNSGSTPGSSSVANGITIPNLPVTGSPGNNFGERVSTLSGSVWLDTNNDGTRQAGEAGIAGVLVTLSGIDAAGTSITRTATTDSNGNYSFVDLLAAGPAGYTVTEQATQPVVGAVITLNGKTAAGSTGGSASAPGSAPSVISGIPLAAGSDSTDNRFGELLPVAISGTVFLDLNNNGLQNSPGDAGLPNVAVVVSGTDDTGTAVTRTLTTAADGSYSVSDLRPGTYTVSEPTQPAGTSNGLTIAGSAGGSVTPPATAPSVISGIVLATSGAASTGNNFAEIPNNGLLNGTVWLDSNNNGLIDGSEAGIAGVAIELSGIDTAGRTVTRSTTTDSSGRYSFASLAPGAYKVNEPAQPPGTVNGSTVPGSTGGTATAVATVPSAISAINLGVGATSSANNFGEVPGAEISGSVYADNNNNGVRDGSEAGLSGVTLVLTGTDDLGNAVSLTVLTGADGSYSFANLRPGTYTVTEPTQPAGTVNGITTPGSSGGTATAPTTAISGIGAIVLTPGAKATGNNFGELANSPDLRVTKSAVEAQFTVGFPGHYLISVRNAGEIASSGVVTVSDRLPGGLTLAATPAGSGWACVGAIGASIFSCTSRIAIAAGVTSASTISATVNVATAAAAGTSVDNVVMVDGGGEIEARRPSAAERDAFNNNPSALPVCVAGAVQNILQNACRTPTAVQLSAAISGTVWYDVGSTPRILDAGDRRLPGWLVEIIDTSNGNSAGAIVGRATTAADGTYKVTGLMPGVPLAVRFRDPASGIVFGYPVNGETAPGSSGASCNTNAAANGTASSCVGTGNAPALSVVLAPGQELPQQSMPVDPSGVVYDSGLRTPVAGSTVTLAPVGNCTGWNPGTALVGATLGGYTLTSNSAAMTVGADGFYQFLFGPSAPASCTFGLTVTPPAGYTFLSTAIAPTAGPLVPAGGTGSVYAVQPQASAPVGAAGTATRYFLTLTSGSAGANIIHNHIPLDPVLPSAVALSKTGDKAKAEVGDTVRYTITVSVTSGPAPRQTTVVDRLPAGFTYIKGTAMVGEKSIADPQGGLGPTLAFNLGAMPASKQLVLRYRVRVNVGAMQGDGINRARGQACGVPAGCVDAAFNPLGGAVATNEAAYRVKVSGGVFATEACVVGKIFVDCNHNHIQDPEELGIPGVRLVLQDGTTLISDSEGKYSVCGIPAKSAVLKVDGLTLPRGSRLTTSSNRNLGDADSLWLDLKNGELHRADFIEGSCSNTVLEQVKARRAQGEVRAPETEKPSGPALRFDSKPKSPQQGTDAANQSVPKPRVPETGGGRGTN